MDISSLRERGGRDVLSVSELNAYVKNMFDLDRTLETQILPYLRLGLW